MKPYIINNNSLEAFILHLPIELFDAWAVVDNSNVQLQKNGLNHEISSQSKYMWANYLASILQLHSFSEMINEELDWLGYDFEISSPKIEDLRLLIGSHNALIVYELLKSFFKKNLRDELKNPIYPLIQQPLFYRSSRLRDQRKPENKPHNSQYQKVFKENLNLLFTNSKGVKDYLESIFLAQRNALQILNKQEVSNKLINS